jgi:hypothetical protein
MRALLLILLLFAFNAEARSSREKRVFAHAHPCPSTGRQSTACPGYVIDHIIPLCAGGADRSTNMQWQALADAQSKDRREVAYCSCLRKKMPNCTFVP